jgi:hypothetical protein
MSVRLEAEGGEAKRFVADLREITSVQVEIPIQSTRASKGRKQAQKKPRQNGTLSEG